MKPPVPMIKPRINSMPTQITAPSSTNHLKRVRSWKRRDPLSASKTISITPGVKNFRNGEASIMAVGKWLRITNPINPPMPMAGARLARRSGSTRYCANNIGTKLISANGHRP